LAQNNKKSVDKKDKPQVGSRQKINLKRKTWAVLLFWPKTKPEVIPVPGSRRTSSSYLRAKKPLKISLTTAVFGKEGRGKERVQIDRSCGLHRRRTTTQTHLPKNGGRANTDPQP
jgi:hypothetical protein